jgi:raffinose/stachyose/melibiose transport system substrate-binding protein
MTWDTTAVMQNAVSLFEKKYPSVTVEMTYTPPVTQYISTLQERLLAGTAADIFIYTAENLAQLNAGHFVMNLADQPWVKYMATANRQYMSADGGVWALSPAAWTAGVIYNTDILAKAGYKSIPTVWDDFLELCAKLKRKGYTAYSDAGGNNWMALEGLIGSHYMQAYGRNVDPEIFAGKLSFQQAWEEPLTQYARLYSEELVPESTVGLTGTELDQQVAVGKQAMLGSGPWDVTSIQQDNPKISLFMGAIPGVPPGRPYWAGAPNEGWAVNAKAHNPKAALAFLSFLASPQGAAAYIASEGFPSTLQNSSIPPKPALKAAAVAAKASQYYFTAVSWPSVYFAQLGVTLEAEIEALIEGKQTVKQVLEAMDAEVERLRK